MECVGDLTLKHQARCVVPHLADRSKHQFLTATTSLRSDNELLLVDYDDDTGVITRKATFAHKDEVWCIAPSPLDAGLVFTAHNAGADNHVSLWRMPGVEAADTSDEDDDDAGEAPTTSAAGAGGGVSAMEPQELESIVSLPGHTSTAHTVVWSPTAKVRASDVMTLDKSTIRLWGLSDGGRTAKPSQSAEVGAAQQLHDGAWDPHHTNEFTVAVDANIQTWDVRTMTATRCVENSHTQCVRALSYNPNKPWFLSSGGDDGLVKFWDLRRADAPVRALKGHTHWVWSVAFNPFHDQLVLSAGSDGEALLWQVSSVSSAPLLAVDDDEKAAADALIDGVRGHDDSVYSVAWSACNAWTFASLSYSGRLSICCVPADQKYKILL